jgi:stage V sporulation protein SpoVS
MRAKVLSMSDPATTPQPAPQAPPAVPKEKEECLFKVSGGTDCKRLAAAIAGAIEREGKRVVLEYIGAGACSQAIKAICIANTFLSRRGQYITGLPTFVSRSFADNNDAVGMQVKLMVHNIG